MAFTMRQPFKLSSTLIRASKPAFRQSTPTTRALHTRPSNFFTLTSQTRSSSSNSPPKARHAFSFPSSPILRIQRMYNSAAAEPSNASLTQKLLLGGAVVGGTLLISNLVFNRSTRDDGGMPAYEREYLNDTFLHTGLGVGIIGMSARAMFQSGFTYRLMATNPWVVMIGGLALSVGTMMGTRATDPENYMQKYALWGSFNVVQGALLAPLLFMCPPAIIGRAGLYTVAMMGGISIVGATAKQDKYLYLGGPLVAGVCVLMAAGLAPMVLPATAVRTLAFTENLWLYGGLAVFGGFTLYDVQKILMHARLAEQGAIRKDAVNESISLELDFLNIFIRIVQILMMSQQRKK